MHSLHRRVVKWIPINPSTLSSQNWAPGAGSLPASHIQRLNKFTGKQERVLYTGMCLCFPWLAVVICTLLSWALHLAAASTAIWQVHTVVWPHWPNWVPFLFIAWVIQNKTLKGDVFSSDPNKSFFLHMPSDFLSGRSCPSIFPCLHSTHSPVCYVLP